MSRSIYIAPNLMEKIYDSGEAAYPEEAAGLMLGTTSGEARHVVHLVTFDNARELPARHNRYLLTPDDYLHGEQEAERMGLELIGVFHSHPDHPNRPSEFDREWAMPWWSYIITSVERGRAAGSRSWVLSEDRSGFVEEPILVAAREA